MNHCPKTQKKIYLLITLTVLISNIIIAQDIIVQHNGDEIKSKIIEITDETIKYKEFDFQNGPTRNINIYDVFMVIYENGRREKFSPKTPSTPTTVSEKKTETELNTKGNYFSIAPGWGNSYGGLGVRLQYVTSGKVRVGIHAGAGISNDIFMVSAGAQIYFWKYMYVDAQFGIFGYEYYSTQYWNGLYYDYYFYDDILFGPSLMVGYDWFFTDHIGVNFGTGFSYAIEGSGYLALDGGLVFRF